MEENNRTASGPGTETATISLGMGAAVQVDNYVDTITDSIDGTIAIVKDSYDDLIESIEEQIDAMEYRLERKREKLNRAFIAMEDAVSKSQAQAGWLSSI